MLHYLINYSDGKLMYDRNCRCVFHHLWYLCVMQNTLTNENESESTNEISIGIPQCACGKCIEELFDEDEQITVSMDELKAWMLKECPGTKAA